MLQVSQGCVARDCMVCGDRVAGCRGGGDKVHAVAEVRRLGVRVGVVMTIQDGTARSNTALVLT